MSKIIVSYRRSDSAAITGRIFDRLVDRYGEESVFMDIDRIPFGTDFRHHIQDALQGADVLLAVIGPTWLGKTADGRTRILDEADPVRVEIEAALKQGLTVIPVLVDNATMPGAADLPESIRDFAYINAAPIDVGRDFRQHMERLTRSIDGIVGTDKAAMEAVLARGYPDAPKASSWSARRMAAVIGSVAVVLGGAIIAINLMSERVGQNPPVDGAPQGPRSPSRKRPPPAGTDRRRRRRSPRRSRPPRRAADRKARRWSRGRRRCRRPRPTACCPTSPAASRICAAARRSNTRSSSRSRPARPASCSARVVRPKTIRGRGARRRGAACPAGSRAAASSRKKPARRRRWIKRRSTQRRASICPRPLEVSGLKTQDPRIAMRVRGTPHPTICGIAVALSRDGRGREARAPAMRDTHCDARNTPSLKKNRNGVVPLAPPSNARHLPSRQSVPPCTATASNSVTLE